MIWMSEVEKHRQLAVEFLKSATEQAGAPVKARGFKRDPKGFRVMAQIFMTSNNAPRFDDPAGGFARRLCLWEFPRQFQGKDVDPDLRDKILRGDFNSELLWIAKGFYTSITSDYNPGTIISPKPALMIEVEAELAPEQSPHKRLVEFIETRCCWCSRNDATNAKIWRHAAKDFCGVSYASIGPLLAIAGVKSESRGSSAMESGRIMTRSGPTRSAAESCLRLLTEDEIKKNGGARRVKTESHELPESKILADPFA